MPIPAGYTSGQIVQAVPTGINSALVLIKTQTIGTTVSSVTVSDVFSATYDAYKVTITGGTASADLNIGMALGASTTQYYSSGNFVDFTSGANATSTVNNGSNWSRVGFGTTSETLVANVDIYNPFLVKFSYASALHYKSSANLGTVMHQHNVAASYTAFTLSTSTGTITGGTIRVYGYTNS